MRRGPRPALLALGVALAAFTFGVWTARATEPRTDPATCARPCRIVAGRVVASWNPGAVSCFEDEVMLGRRANVDAPWFFRCVPADDYRRVSAGERGGL